MHSDGPIDGSEHVVDLPFSFVMLSAAGADAAKVESQRGHVGVLQTAGRAKDHLVVQRATAERVRMTDHGDAGWILKFAIQRFQTSRVAEEIDVAQRLPVHAILTRTRSPSTFTSWMTTRKSGLPTHAPLSILKVQKCQGQTISFPRTSPSDNGPPRCGHVLSAAKNPFAVWKRAIFRSPIAQVMARPTGRSFALATSMNSGMKVYA